MLFRSILGTALLDVGARQGVGSKPTYSTSFFGCWGAKEAPAFQHSASSLLACGSLVVVACCWLTCDKRLGRCWVLLGVPSVIVRCAKQATNECLVCLGVIWVLCFAGALS